MSRSDPQQLSFVRVELETEDLYRDVAGDVEMWLDTSEFAVNHPSGIPTSVNKKVIGIMKDEAGGTRSCRRR